MALDGNSDESLYFYEYSLVFVIWYIFGSESRLHEQNGESLRMILNRPALKPLQLFLVWHK